MGSRLREWHAQTEWAVVLCGVAGEVGDIGAEP